MKKQTKDFLFDLLWNVCFSSTFMCNILQKDYNFTPPSHTHTHTHCHWSLALLHPSSPPHPVSICHSPSLSLIWLVGFNDGSLNGGLISLLAVWSAAVHTFGIKKKNKQKNRQNVELRWDWPINFKENNNPTGATGLLCDLVLDRWRWTACLFVCLSVRPSVSLPVQLSVSLSSMPGRRGGDGGGVGCPCVDC